MTAAISCWIPNIPTSPIVLVLSAAVAFVLDRTPIGVTLRAFGASPVAMSRAGWSAPKYATLRYFIAGVFGLLAGLSLTAINTASDCNSGGSYTLLSAVTSGLSLGTLSGIAISSSFLVLAALGRMAVVTTGGGDIDLSIASVTTSGACIALIVIGGHDSRRFLGVAVTFGLGLSRFPSRPGRVTARRRKFAGIRRRMKQRLVRDARRRPPLTRGPRSALN